MSALVRPTAQSVTLRALLWLARLGSLVSIAMLAAFAFEPSGLPTLREGIALAFFPAGVVIGMVLAWWRPLLGGALGMLSLATFYGWWSLNTGHPPGGPYFAMFSLPGAVFLLCGIADRCARWNARVAP